MQPPILSLTERDRRWARVRHLMHERGFDGLLVAGFRSREMYETYISDDYNEGCVLFPLEGDPVVITWAHLRVMRARWSQTRGAKLWVADYRVATCGAGVAEVLAGSDAEAATWPGTGSTTCTVRVSVIDPTLRNGASERRPERSADALRCGSWRSLAATSWWARRP